VDWTVRQGSNVLSGTETRLRLGIAECTEVLADVPTYFYSLNGRASSGFSDLVVSFKRELPVPFGFHLSAAGGLGLPTGTSMISSQGYDPYIQFPWSRGLTDEWSLHGMFTVTWFTSQHISNPTFEPTLSFERDLGSTGDLFVEYVGDYPNHAKSCSASRWWRLLAGDETSAARFSRRVRIEQQFSRSLLRDWVFISARRAIERFGW
jgi:hypothetical protein